MDSGFTNGNNLYPRIPRIPENDLDIHHEQQLTTMMTSPTVSQIPMPNEPQSEVPPGFHLLAALQQQRNPTGHSTVQQIQDYPDHEVKKSAKKYATSNAVLGAFQIVFGLFFLAVGLTWFLYLHGMILFYTWYVYGSLIAGGLLILIAGSLGVGGRKGNKRSVLITCTIFCIFSVVMAVGIFVFNISHFVFMDCFDMFIEHAIPDELSCILHFVILIVSFLEFVIAIVQAGLCSHQACSAAKKPQQIFNYFYITNGAEQVIPTAPSSSDGSIPPPAYSTYDRR